MSTQENLKEAFAGESQANRTYLAFALRAEKDGYPQVARLFRAAADSETVHALYHLDAMDGVNGTLENLKEAQSGENYEHTDMYPRFIAEAEAEGDKRARLGFMYASRVEEVHEAKFAEAEAAIAAGGDIEDREYQVCQYCGNVEHSVLKKCPICGMPASFFKRVD